MTMLSKYIIRGRNETIKINILQLLTCLNVDTKYNILNRNY